MLPESNTVSAGGSLTANGVFATHANIANRPAEDRVICWKGECPESNKVARRHVATNVGKNSCGVILTGMGKDGAEGLLSIKKSGGYTIARMKIHP